jgi:TrmH family RNA methyltransferase
VHAADVFEQRILATTFEEAVAEARVVIGTTSRREAWHIPVEPIGDVFGDVHRRGLAGSDVALVFGPEDRGLSNDELSRCHRLAFVPTASEYASLNLAQAAIVCLYEWMRSSTAGPGGGHACAAVATGAVNDDENRAATAGAQADAIADLRDVLTEIGFLDGDQSERVMATIASMLTRSGLDDREVRILRGIVRQIRWAARR